MAGTNFNFELYFDLSPDLLCIAGFDGYFKKINPAVSQVLGYSMEELYSRPINDFVHKEDQKITEKVRLELTHAKPLYNFENRYVTRTGEIVWLTWTSFPIKEDRVIFAIAKNITHKKRLEAERNALLTDLTEVNQDLRQISYSTSHDLRSPVSSLMSIFDLIDVSKISDRETIEILELLKLSGEKLEQTLNNYVEVINEKRREEVTVEEVDLHKSLDNVLQSIYFLIQNSKVTITSDFTRLHKIRFNKAYMESVFLNLITNSIKYARPDALPVITIRSEHTEESDRILFSDNGLGFNMDKVKDKIFGLHQKFHNHTDSRGIGLYLVYNHVTDLGGDIKVDSKVNEGTTFTITFPGKN